MKSYLYSVFTLLILIGCSKKESDKNLHITGNIEGLKKGTLYIQKIVDTTLLAIDTIEISGNSNFAVDLNISSPEMYYLFLDRGVTNSIDNNLPFFAEPGKINIDTSLKYFFTDSKITGSKNHDKYVEYRKVLSEFSKQNLTLTEQKFKAFKDKNTKVYDSITKLQENILKRKYLYTANFAVTNGNLEVAPYVVLSEIYDVNLKFLDTIQKSMTPSVSKSVYGLELNKLYKSRKKSENQQIN